MKAKKFVRVLAMLLAVAMVLTSCGGSGGQSGSSGSQSQGGSTSGSNDSTGAIKSVTIAMTGAWDVLQCMNSVGGNYADTVFDQLYDRFIHTTEEGNFEPRLASSWEMSDDYKTLTLKLNEKAVWHDGVPLTSEDVVWTLQTILNPECAATQRAQCKGILGTDDTGACADSSKLGVKAIDEHTVEIQFKQPTDIDQFWATFGRYIFVWPKHCLENIPLADISKDEFWLHPIGSGPFKYDSDISGDRIEMVKNADYFLGEPDIDRLIIKVVAAANLLAGMMSGEIDVIGGNSIAPMDPKDIDEAKKLDTYESYEIPTNNYTYLAINNQTINDSRVRWAMSLAIDRQSLVDDLLRGHGIVAVTNLPYTHKYYNQNIKPIERDVERAKELLAEAGWDSNRVLKMVVTTGSATSERTAALIQQYFSEIGIKIELQMVDFPTLMSMLQKGEVDLGCLGSAGSIDPDEFTNLINPGGPYNFGAITDSKYYELSLAAVQKATFDERKPIYDELQEYMYDQQMYAFLYHKSNYFAYNKRLSNVEPGAFANLCLQTYKWKVEA